MEKKKKKGIGAYSSLHFTLKWLGVYGALPQFFAYFNTDVLNILTGVICNCHPHGYASSDTKKKKKKKIKSARRFHAN